MSFVGGGSDFFDYYKNNYGLVVSTTINQYVYTTVNRRLYSDIRISYSETEWPKKISLVKHHIIREAMKKTGVITSVDISYTADVPPAHVGSGLGSSSAIAVGVLHALHAYLGHYVSPAALAEEACAIEIDILKHPIGKQDQYASAFGGLNQIRFSKKDVMVNPLLVNESTVKDFQKKLLMFHTGLASVSANILPEQKRKLTSNRPIIDKMVQIAEKFKDSLIKKNIDDLGQLLHQNWILKQSLASNISNSKINRLYKDAREAGAVGGKILGSGGGGFLLVFADPKNHSRIRRALSKLKEVDFAFEPNGSRIIHASN